MFNYQKFDPITDGSTKEERQTKTILGAYRKALDMGSPGVALELRISNPDLDSEFDRIVRTHDKVESKIQNKAQQESLRAWLVISGIFLAGMWVWIAVFSCTPFVC